MAGLAAGEDKTSLFFRMNVMILRAECVYPQEPFPSSAHVFLECCMGDKFYKGEFWGCHVLLFIMD